MDLYTLTDTFLDKDVVDEYVSAIWTERYSAAGDFQLVVAYTKKNRAMLQEGTYLALRGSKEVMEIETVVIENNLMTVTGTTLTEAALNQRYAWFRTLSGGSDPTTRVADYFSDDAPAGQFIANIVELIVIDPVIFEDEWEPANMEWDLEVIPYLSLGAVDTTGDAKPLTAIIGPLYDSIQQVAEKEGVGISLYLESADPDDGYSLKFKTYRGVDHTTGGAGDLVRLTPAMDSLNDVKEVHSIALWKNVCYVYYNGQLYPPVYEIPEDPPLGLQRRVLVTDAEKAPVGHKVVNPNAHEGDYNYYYTVVSPADIDAFILQNARDALANHNYIHAVDGQTSPNNDYKYGEHYGLGDMIELEGLSGAITKARVTEFIRSQDQEGAKEYPTISVVQPTEE